LPSLVALLAMATGLALPAHAGAQTLTPPTFELRLVIEPPFHFAARWAWVSTFSSPYQARFVYSVDTNAPRIVAPDILPDDQRCNSAPVSGGATALIPISPTVPGSYTMTLRVKVCIATNGVYQAVEVASVSGWGVIEADGTASGGAGSTPPQLKILSQTTRWRPQREETSPIVLHFRGPATLDTSSVALDLTPPNGLANYTPTFGPAALVDGKTDEYTAEWRGPWRIPDGNGGQQPLPSGNYGFVVRGRAAGATEELASQPYEKVSLVEVVGIEVQPFVGSIVEPDPRPGAPNSRRIFAEAQQAASVWNPAPEVYDTVRLVARISPAVDLVSGQDPVKVFFRAVDVDDPAASSQPVDNEGRSADNEKDAGAGLFRLEGWTPPGAAPDAGVGSVTDQVAPSGGDEAVVVMRVSPRQGDNYRFIASTQRTWVEAPVASQGPAASGALPAWLVDAQAQPLDTGMEGTQVSHLLTVWRTLHVEVDHLVSTNTGADQAAMDLKGTFTALRDRMLTDATGPFVQSTPPANHWVARNTSSGWQGGELRALFHGQDLYAVTGNSATDIDVSLAQGQPTLLNGLTSAQAAQLPAADREYVAQDDHIGSLASMTADIGLATQLLEQAFIRLLPEQAAEQVPDIPFVMSANVTPGQGQLDLRNIRENALYGLPAEGRSTPAYWSIQLVSAFEGDPAGDMDPQSEGSFNLGVAHIGQCADSRGGAASGACKPHAALFLEVVRDLTNKPQGFANLPPTGEIIRRATAHELFHGLGLGHGHALMCAGRMLNWTRADGGQLTDDHVAALRKVEKPVMSHSTQSTCR
jgi:hypothetical protein